MIPCRSPSRGRPGKTSVLPLCRKGLGRHDTCMHHLHVNNSGTSVDRAFCFDLKINRSRKRFAQTVIRSCTAVTRDQVITSTSLEICLLDWGKKNFLFKHVHAVFDVKTVKTWVFSLNVYPFTFKTITQYIYIYLYILYSLYRYVYLCANTRKNKILTKYIATSANLLFCRSRLRHANIIYYTV